MRMRINSKGQVTIPAKIRKDLGLMPGCEVSLDIDIDRLIRQKARSGSGSKGKELVERMRGRATTGLTTDEIMALTRGE
jgi:AbrB family looped-hinge helix DNA binding protein